MTGDLGQSAALDGALPEAGPSLARTPLHALHLRSGARMVPFAGCEMPLNYPSGLLKEHLHTRASAGLFDVSHMGQITLVPRSGDLADAARALEGLLPIDVLRLKPNRQRYGLLTSEAGGILDDLMVANLGDRLLLVVNAACKTADEAHLRARLSRFCEITALHRALIALQGPKAEAALAQLVPNIGTMRFMDVREAEILGAACVISRSGYTGEDGFEISVPADTAEEIANGLLRDPSVLLIGLGARDSLRLEAGLCLYGADIDAETTPVEAGLTWAIQPVRRRGGSREGGFPGDYSGNISGDAMRPLIVIDALHVLPARPKKPRDKAKVENGVRFAQSYILGRLRKQTFFSLAECNAAIARMVERINAHLMRRLGTTRRALFEAVERAALQPLPTTDYVFAEWRLARVNLDYHVEAAGFLYSVPHALIREQVDVRLTARTVEVFHRGQRVAAHDRRHGGQRHGTDPEHMPSSHRRYAEWTHARFERWAREIGPETEGLVIAILHGRPHPEQGFRTCLGVLRLYRGLAPARAEAVSARAVAIGALTYKSIASILANNLDRTTRPPEAALVIDHPNLRGARYFH